VQDAKENVGAPSNFHRQRSSPKRYTGYMALMIELVETEPSYFEEEIKKSFWAYAIVEDYGSIMKNSGWEVVPRSTNK